MAAHRSTGKRSSRSTDTRSRWTGATVRRTVSGREMSPLELYNARARSRRSRPRIRQAGSGCPSAGRRSTTSRTWDTPRPTPNLTSRPPPAGPGLRRQVCARTSPTWTTRSSAARELGIDPSDVARRYERAYLDDMRALRNDSVDVYARPSDNIDQVISQTERLQQAGTRRHQGAQLVEIVHRLGGSTRASLPGRASARSCPRRARASRPDGPRGTAMCSCENGAVGSAGSRPWGPSGGPREPRVSGARSSARDTTRSRTSVTCQVDRHAPPSAASRSSQARSHRRHSSADRRQCSW
jgi:hypothetical protein